MVGGAGPRFDWKTPRSPKTSMLMGVAAFLLMGVADALMLTGVAEFLLGVLEGVLFWVRDGDLGTVRLGDLAGPPSEEGTFGDVSAPRMARVSRRPGLCMRMGRARAAISAEDVEGSNLNACDESLVWGRQPAERRQEKDGREKEGGSSDRRARATLAGASSTQPYPPATQGGPAGRPALSRRPPARPRRPLARSLIGLPPRVRVCPPAHERTNDAGVHRPACGHAWAPPTDRQPLGRARTYVRGRRA